MLLLPAIDLRAGRCVRLLHGDYAAETEYPVTAEALYDRYAALGARWLHVVDLDGARVGQQAQGNLIGDLAGRGPMRLQVGGGVRDTRAVEALLAAGVERVVVGSVALGEPHLVVDWLRRFGPQAVVIALDVRLDAERQPRVATHGWTRQSDIVLWDALAPFLAHGLCHVLCTDVGRDGALTGPNCALYEEAARRYPSLAWQASGGVRDARDLAALASVGASAAVSGRALLENRILDEELRPYLRGA
jgi:phosphoribosylformimino-5-aminoimidazole carboxamide ribotide isomerase